MITRQKRDVLYVKNMAAPDSHLLVSLTITKFEKLKDVVKIIRLYSDKSVGEISTALKKGDAVFGVFLVKTEFYNGWESLYEITKNLLDISASFIICVNGEEVNIQFLQDLKKKVTNIKREDIY